VLFLSSTMPAACGGGRVQALDTCAAPPCVPGGRIAP
jgi:hypothetical protein